MFSNILSIVGISLEVIILFNLLIVVHELGHFLAARWRGLVVEKFAIWFGKPLWSKTINGVEYRLGSIPAGGFVAIPQLAPMESLEGESKQKHEDLPPVSPLDKIIVAIAGPVFSLLLAFAFACIIWGVGRPVSEAERTAVIGYVLPDGPAAKAGLEPGDKILAVNAHPVTRITGMGKMSDSVSWNVAVSQSPLIPIRFERDGKEHIVEVEPVAIPRKGWGRKNLRQIQVLPAQTPVIAKVIPQSPAANAGLRSGDRVEMANGTKLLSPITLAEIIKKVKSQPLLLVVARKQGDDMKTFSVKVSPVVPIGEKEPRLGIMWNQRGIVVLSHPNPWQQIAASVSTMWETISAVATPHSEITVQHLSGPVGIMRIYYMLFESPMGWRLALWFSVVLNVNLALLNMLPFPVLDGGHILLGICEWIVRKPIEHRVLEWIQSGFAIILIGFMLYVTFYDVLDLPPIMGNKADTAEKVPVMKFEPKPSSANMPNK